MSPRNHFSKHGGPYFINDGYTHHEDIPNTIKPGKDLFYFITIVFVSLLVTIGIVLTSLN